MRRSVCHATSRGGGSSATGFDANHGGLRPRHTSACNVCHTATPSTHSEWPCAFQWKRRSIHLNPGTLE
ncbi:MAG TPA: hypothetical protein VGQ83_34255 [Polyangia bacterium]